MDNVENPFVTVEFAGNVGRPNRLAQHIHMYVTAYLDEFNRLNTWWDTRGLT